MTGADNSSSPLRAAVSGLRHGKEHCDAYREHPECELVGLFDPDDERAATRREENPGAVAYPSFDEMLDAARPDVVSIASPEFAHAGQTVKALEAGCHVLLEKAMACTHADIEAILDAVVRTGKLLYVGHEVRLTPAFADARRMLRSGELGEVYQAWSCYVHNCEYLCVDGQWRGDIKLGNDPMLGGGCHPVDLLRWLLGEVNEVFAYQTHKNRDAYPFPDATTVVLRFESGSMATVDVTAATRRPYHLGLKLNGTRGYFEGDNSGADYVTAFAGPLEDVNELTPTPTTLSSHDIAGQVDNLVDTIRGRAQLFVDAWEGANSASVCIAAIESAQTGAPVTPRFYRRPG
jgi:predicted dehydrogenase